MKKYWIASIVVILVTIVGVYFYITRNDYYLGNDNSNVQEYDMTVAGQVERVKEETVQLLSAGEFVGEATAILQQGNAWFRIQIKGNLNPAPENKFYEAWLVPVDETSGWYSLYDLKKQDDGTYFVSYAGSRDILDVDKVLITLEGEEMGFDGQAETTVLEGDFSI
ncbi:MAG: anti-sigma factor [Patescibacteria group bacterium]